MELLGAALDYSIWFLTHYWPAVIVAVIAPLLPLERLRRFRPATRRAGADIAAIVALSIAATVSAGFMGGLPLPTYQDDYGYLLSADTFLHGRLANPPHPHWRHFETFYVLMQPTYAAKYPPAQGAFLALGRLLTGVALSGMWIAAAAMSVAFYWMLRAWLPPGWSLIGGLAAAIHPTTIEWSQSLHGGCVPALAGALVIGGVPNLIRRGRIIDGLVTGAGLVLLANSRPYEGAVLAILMMGVGVWMLVRSRGRIPIRAAAAGGALLLGGAAFILTYNEAVTGNPWELPFRTYDQRYASAPDFIWQKPIPPRQYRHRDMDAQYRIFRSYYHRERHLDEFRRSVKARSKLLLTLIAPLGKRPLSGLAMLLFLPLFALPCLLARQSRVRLLVPVLLLFGGAVLQVTWWTQSHYPSPAAGVAAIIYLGCLRQLSVWRRRSRSGLRLALAVLMVFAIVSLSAWYRIGMANSPPHSPAAIRNTIEQALEGRAGDDLVLVSQELPDVVFNAADIDRSPIVWAHEMGGEEDRRLLRYYNDRTVWHAVFPDERARLILLRLPVSGSRSGR